MDNILIVILGPTGVGKSDLSVEIARHFKCEIVSADSRQFYREMRIGTAVPSDYQLAAIKHHFVRSLSVKDYYSASIFERDVLKLLPSLFVRNKKVIMTGGSGMYVDAVCNGIDDIPDTDPSTREKFNNLYRIEGIAGLRSALKLLDPDYYASVDLRNHKRIIRALEICESTGRPYSSFLTKKKAERDFRIIRIGLKMERDELYERIDKRVDKMVADGLEEEARQLFDMRSFNALNCVGYREFFDYFESKISREKAIALIKRNSRRYAKRQMTWWARDKSITWFRPDQAGEIIKFIEERIGNLLTG
jgi:tRNA dimethylallyltransferase